MSDDGISRREVVVGLMVAGAASAVAGCNSMMKKKEEPPKITTGVINIGSAAMYPAGTVHQTFLATYGIVLVNDSGTVLAIRPRCTHLGCTVKWVAGDVRFECPCHGSEFDILGRPTKGPAKRPLPGVTAKDQPDGTLTVDLDKVYAQV